MSDPTAPAIPIVTGPATPGVPRLVEEARALAWIHGELALGRALPALEANAVAQGVALALREVGPGKLPRVGETTVIGALAAHSLNAALAAGAFANAQRLDSTVVGALVLAALMADIGLARVDFDPLAPEPPTPEQWERMRRHPVEGARVLMQAGSPFELPAVVCYEHHLSMDGSGYPERAVKRPPHFASRVVHIADSFTAMTEPRPRRPAHPADAALAQMETEAGTAFDKDLLSAFVASIQHLPVFVLAVE